MIIKIATGKDQNGNIQWTHLYSRAIRNRLRKDLNLADIPDPAEARKNLGIEASIVQTNDIMFNDLKRYIDQQDLAFDNALRTYIANNIEVKLDNHETRITTIELNMLTEEDVDRRFDVLWRDRIPGVKTELKNYSDANLATAKSYSDSNFNAAKQYTDNKVEELNSSLRAYITEVITPIQNDIRTIKSDIVGIKNDILSLTTRVSTLESNYNALRSDHDALYTYTHQQVTLLWEAINKIDILPVGSIVPYVGSLSDIPNKWEVCNDFKDRFMLGTDSSNISKVNNTGGTATQSITLSVNNLPRHKHDGYYLDNSLLSVTAMDATNGNPDTPEGGDDMRIAVGDNPPPVSNDVNTKPAFSTGYAGSGSAISFDNMPPYKYVLYIKKVRK